MWCFVFSKVLDCDGKVWVRVLRVELFLGVFFVNIELEVLGILCSIFEKCLGLYKVGDNCIYFDGLLGIMFYYDV